MVLRYAGNTSAADEVCEKNNEKMVKLDKNNKDEILYFINHCKTNLTKGIVFRTFKKNDNSGSNVKTNRVNFKILKNNKIRYYKDKYLSNLIGVICEIQKDVVNYSPVVIGCVVTVVLLSVVLLVLIKKQVSN